ncbi:MAG: hypothetical protein KDC39_03550 [Actinobacteria bacterium]|nr:hypothetical protein [Actinomycetota bacterium]
MTDNPIGFRDRLNASVLLRVTPEYGTIREAQSRHERAQPSGLTPSSEAGFPGDRRHTDPLGHSEQTQYAGGVNGQ